MKETQWLAPKGEQPRIEKTNSDSVNLGSNPGSPANSQQKIECLQQVRASLTGLIAWVSHAFGPHRWSTGDGRRSEELRIHWGGFAPPDPGTPVLLERPNMGFGHFLRLKGRTSFFRRRIPEG